MNDLRLTWHGHSCFHLTCDNYHLVLDPYDDFYVPGLGALSLSAHEVLSSHGHKDHGADWVVSPLPPGPSPFQVTKIPSFHDPEGGSLRGTNTIHLIECKGIRLAHLGDLGEALSPAQGALLQGLDALMIPVGGFYTIGPGEAAEIVAQVKPRLVFPMHYRSEAFGFPPLALLDEFLALTGGGVFYPGNSRMITPDAPPEICVLSYLG